MELYSVHIREFIEMIISFADFHLLAGIVGNCDQPANTLYFDWQWKLLLWQDRTLSFGRRRLKEESTEERDINHYHRQKDSDAAPDIRL